MATLAHGAPVSDAGCIALFAALQLLGLASRMNGQDGEHWRCICRVGLGPAI